MIERIEKVIPETIEVYWKTSDGKRFSSEEDAVKYERQCEEYKIQKEEYETILDIIFSITLLFIFFFYIFDIHSCLIYVLHKILSRNSFIIYFSYIGY